MGARFEYEGVEYVKTAALFATANGRQRLIPKYAVLKVLDASLSQTGKDPAQISKQSVMAAFDQFWSDCLPLIRDADQPTATAARNTFLKALG